MPDGMYRMPDAPSFLERRDDARPRTTQPVIPYELARAKAQEASARRQAQAREYHERMEEPRTFEAFSTQRGATFIDFDELERRRRWDDPGYSTDQVFHEASAQRPASRAASPRRETRNRPYHDEPDWSARPSRRYERRQEPRRADPSWYRDDRGGYDDRRYERRRRDTAAQDYLARRHANDTRYDYDEWDDEPREEKPRGLLERARHAYRQRKADRSFDRNFADAPSNDEGPRAALYKGKMGRTHQKAARMQDGPSANRRYSYGGANGPRGGFIGSHPRFIVCAIIIACFAFAVSSVYPDAQAYYLQMRANDQAAAEYQAILERNEELANHVTALQTDEGMEELAHESFGWVREGENSVSVLGEGTSDISADAKDQTSAIAEGSVPAPETWYSPILDPVFGYEG